MSRPDGRASAARRRFAGRIALGILALGLAAFARTAAAQPPTLVAALGASGPETIVAQITLNEQKKGQFFVTVIDGRFLARTEDLKAIGLTSARGQTRTSGGEEYVWVDSIAGLRATFDEARLSLDLVADPKLLPETTVDLWSGRGERVYYPDNASAFFNYDIAYSGGNTGAPDGFSTTTQVGARVGDLLFLNDSTCSAISSDRGCVRLTTSLIHDRRETLVRTIVGDFGFASGYLGTTFSMGGLSYSKLYDIDPYFIRYPQQSLTGQLRTPSEVDVYIDGQRVRTLRLPAGDFDLRNITQATGYRSVDLVIRDAFGREQRVSTSFYSSERSLKAGLHEYSYNVGALRENFGVESNDYGPLAFAGFHRYGVIRRVDAGRPRRRKERPRQRRSDGDHRARGGGAAQRRGIGQRAMAAARAAPRSSATAISASTSTLACWRARTAPIMRRSSTSGSSGATTNSRATSATRRPHGDRSRRACLHSSPTKDRTAGRRA